MSMDSENGDDMIQQDGDDMIQQDADDMIQQDAVCNTTTYEEAHGIVSDILFGETMEGLRNAARGRHDNSAEWRQRPTMCSVPDELKRRNAVQQADEHQGYMPVAVRIVPRELELDEPDEQQGYMSFSDVGSAVGKMEVYKWGCLQQLINQHHRLLQEPKSTDVLVRACLESMIRIMSIIKACYGISASDLWTATDDDLAGNILLSGCFILHRLLKYTGSAQRNQLDEEHEWAWQFVTRDLLLLENQIPFLVVRKLCEVFMNDNNTQEALVTGSLRLFRSFCPELLHSYPRSDSDPDIAQVHHLLHLFYLSVVHRDRATSSHQDDLLLPELPQWIPHAKVLKDSGVRFRRRKDAKSFLDIKFDVRRGILEIPPLQLCDYSDALFRNLIAFEQTCPGIGHEISAYAIFMDCLIKTPEDMRILNLRGILMSKISGDRNDSDFFSCISAHVPMPADNYLAALMNDVSKNKDYRRNKWYAELVRNYCRNPWVAMSVFAAVLLLCLTVLQTFFTIYPYYNPRD